MGAPLTPTPPFGTVGLMSSYLRVEINPTDLIANLALAAATVMIQNYTDQIIAQVVDDVQVLDGTGNDIILLPELPVQTVTQVIADVDKSNPITLNPPSEGSNADWGFTDGMDGLLIRRTGEYIVWDSLYTASYGIWPPRRQSVQVTYTHGWPTTPTDLQMLCSVIAARAFAQDGANQETVGTYIAAYAAQPAEIAPYEKAILDRYKPGRVR
jgi:hypothetical protein